MNPWEQYPAGDAMADPINWAQVNGTWEYVPRGGSTTQVYDATGFSVPQEFLPPVEPTYDPLSSAYVPTTIDYSGAPASSMPPPPPNDATTAPYGGYYGSNTTQSQPGGVDMSTSQYYAQMSTQPMYVSNIPSPAPAGYTPPPVAPGVAPEAALVGGPVAAPQYQAGSAPNSGGYANGGYGGGGMAPAPLGNPMMGGMLMPNGQPFGAPKQMAPDGSFDPFLWSGTQNPMPPPSATRAMILQEMGLLNPLTQAPPGPTMQYVAAKLGLELPNALPTGASLASSARPMEQGPPAPMPAVPPIAPGAPRRGNYPPLPPMPLPNRGY